MQTIVSLFTTALLPFSLAAILPAQQIAIAEYTLLPSASPDGITVGQDGALWFTEGYGNKIGRISASGIITEYVSPTNQSGPTGITKGPDGALWFTENSTYAPNKIGRITTSGVIAEYPLPESPLPEPLPSTSSP